jgi:hypothetical protein
VWQRPVGHGSVDPKRWRNSVLKCELVGHPREGSRVGVGVAERSSLTVSLFIVALLGTTMVSGFAKNILGR